MYFLCCNKALIKCFSNEQELQFICFKDKSVLSPFYHKNSSDRKGMENVHWNIKQLIEETMLLIIIFLFDQKNGFPVSIPNLAKKTIVYGKNKVAVNAVVFLLQIWITRKMFIGKQKEQR